jgi:hypothetical protein
LARPLLALLVFGAVDAAADETFTLTVPATANIFGASGELPGGGTLPVCIAKTRFKNRSEVVFSSVSGKTLCLPGEATGTPDGNAGCSTSSTNISPSSGPISGISAPGDLFLIGVFTDNPVGGERPPNLSLSNTSADTYRPKLNQTFFVGDGRTGEGTGKSQRFVVPKGAKRFCLGFADAFFFNGEPGFFDTNVGSLTATFGIERDGVVVAGSVTSPLGPLSGVRIEIEGKTKKTKARYREIVETNADGQFQATVPEGTYTVSPTTTFRFPKSFVPASGQTTKGRPFSPPQYRAGNDDRTDLDFESVQYLAQAGVYRNIVSLPGPVCTLSEPVDGFAAQMEGKNPDAQIVVTKANASPGSPTSQFTIDRGGPYESATFRSGECRGNLHPTHDIGIPAGNGFTEGEDVIVYYID